MGTLYRKCNGTPLRQESHYKLISTRPERTKSSLLMWWLRIRCERWWFWVSLVNQQMQLWNLESLLRSASIEGFMKGTTLFRWPWRCTMHSSVIWIVSLGSVLVFFMTDNREVNYPCFFAFKLLGSVLVLLFNML
jgi:hypothetical protein